MKDKTYNNGEIHKERVFQNQIITGLVNAQEYVKRNNTDYDKKITIDKGLLLEFIKQRKATNGHD